MIYSSDKELLKLDNYYPNSDLAHIYKKYRDKIVSILKTIETLWQTKNLDSISFNILFEGLKITWAGIYFEIIGVTINSMIDKIVDIEKLLYKGIEDKNWQVRFNTVVIMKLVENKKIQNIILDLGEKDRSKKVNEMAIDIRKYYVD